MGTRLVRELVCDICGSNDRVQRWGLLKDGRRKSPDLCHGHGAPLEKLYADLPDKRGNKGKREVLTEAQVQAKARAYRARARRKGA
jgi:hypothetical protein